MIALITDFGLDGLYTGQMHARLIEDNPKVRVIDLCHTIPAHNICSAAYLIPAYSQFLPPSSIIICVIDPGVGSKRPHAVCQADGRWYVGPDNGIFDVLQQNCKSFTKSHFHWQGDVSNSFHGRDVYAPAASLLAKTGSVDDLQTVHADPQNYRFTADLHEIIYIDHFGNALSGVRNTSISKEAGFRIKGKHLSRAGTFSEVEQGECFFYENANGLIEVAANQGSASELLGLQVGDCFTLA